MKLILSTIVTGIVLFGLGGLCYALVFADFFQQYYGHIYRAEADQKIWAFGVASFIQAFFMYIIYSKGYKGGSPVMEGFRFGALAGMFVTLPYVFFTWGGMPVKYTGVIADGVISIVMLTIAGVITGIIHGRKQVPAS